MANWPRVDANNIDEAPEYARQNRAVGFTYEPGSTFKAFTVAGALEERLVTPRTQFTIGPTIQVADRTIRRGARRRRRDADAWPTSSPSRRTWAR